MWSRAGDGANAFQTTGCHSNWSEPQHLQCNNREFLFTLLILVSSSVVVLTIVCGLSLVGKIARF
jgi:hypothetical protein